MFLCHTGIAKQVFLDGALPKVSERLRCEMKAQKAQSPSIPHGPTQPLWFYSCSLNQTRAFSSLIRTELMESLSVVGGHSSCSSETVPISRWSLAFDFGA
eukprot:2789243-Rhodomonas_salina.2